MGRILVTGGAGFLGRRIVAAARAAGHAVVVMSRHPERVRGLPDDVPVLAGDLLRADDLVAVVEAARPDAVVHAAAVVTHDDPRLARVNVGGTAALCTALARAAPRCRLVLVSSFSVEDEPPTTYSDSKASAEASVRQSDLDWVILRPTLIYGPGDGTNTPALVEKMARGSCWIPGGGRARIQPVHVDDVAAACVAAAAREGVTGHVYRLGGPEPVSVRAFREAVREASGGTAVVRSVPLALLAPAGRLLKLLGREGLDGVVRFHRADHAVDSSESRRDLGFAPRSLDEGLAQTFAEGAAPAAR